jgi:hypothetical protein
MLQITPEKGFFPAIAFLSQMIANPQLSRYARWVKPQNKISIPYCQKITNTRLYQDSRNLLQEFFFQIHYKPELRAARSTALV